MEHLYGFQTVPIIYVCICFVCLFLVCGHRFLHHTKNNKIRNLLIQITELADSVNLLYWLDLDTLEKFENTGDVLLSRANTLSFFINANQNESIEWNSFLVGLHQKGMCLIDEETISILPTGTCSKFKTIWQPSPTIQIRIHYAFRDVYIHRFGYVPIWMIGTPTLKQWVSGNCSVAVPQYADLLLYWYQTNCHHRGKYFTL